MGLRKKRSSAKKKPVTDFGAALAKARQETDHIFKQASQDENSNNTNSRSNNNNIDDEKISPRSKAAAWAWYQRGGGSDGNGSPEDVRNRAMVVVQRTSRFKAEALRVNGSYTAGDTIVMAHQKWDPNQSLFDSFELLSVAKELDKALKEASVASITNRNLVSLSCSQAVKNVGGGGGGGRRHMEALAARLSRFIPAPVLCLSEDDIATKRTFKKSKSASSSGSSSSSNVISSSSISSGKSSSSNNNNSNNWLSSKFSQLLTFNPTPVVVERVGDGRDEHLLKFREEEEDDGDELFHLRHEHFHHHLHHHHHHLGGRRE